MLPRFLLTQNQTQDERPLKVCFRQKTRNCFLRKGEATFGLVAQTTRETPMTLQTFAYRTAMAVTLATATIWSSPAAATADGPDAYRVVDVRGNDTLAVRARPSRFARRLGGLAFNAQNIHHTSTYRRSWVRIPYRGRYGWVNTRYLAEQGNAGHTTYRVSGISYDDTLNMRRRPSVRSRVLRKIPRNATGIHDCGPCKNGWCPVTYRGRDGWVSQRYLKVERYSPRLRNDRFSRFDRYDRYDTQGSYEVTSDDDDTWSYRDRSRRRALRWRDRFKHWFYGD